jgi:hypothetical protein
MNSSGSMTIWLVPSLYGLFSCSTTWPARLRCGFLVLRLSLSPAEAKRLLPAEDSAKPLASTMKSNYFKRKANKA